MSSKITKHDFCTLALATVNVNALCQLQCMPTAGGVLRDHQSNTTREPEHRGDRRFGSEFRLFKWPLKALESGKWKTEVTEEFLVCLQVTYPSLHL